MSYQKLPRSQTVYMHLKPGRYAADLVVEKVAKSRDALVEPGTVVVKTKITVPGNFFEEALPYVEIEFKPGDEVAPPEVTIAVDTSEVD